MAPALTCSRGVDACWHDLRAAIRSLTKARGFTAVAVLAFALGIGINAALFSLTNALFFRPLPVERPEEMVYVYGTRPGPRGQGFLPLMDPDAFEYFRKGMGDVFSSVAGHARVSHRLTIDSQSESTIGEVVTGEYFGLLGVVPQLGRVLTPTDEDPSAPVYAMVISDRLWERRFERDPAVIGRKVLLCCRRTRPTQDIDPLGEFEIVGVMRPTFRGVTAPASPADYWTAAVDFFPGATWIGAGRAAIAPIARLRQGVTLEQARLAVRHRGEILLTERRTRANRQPVSASDGTRFDALGASDVADPYSPNNTSLQRQMIAMSIVVAVVLLIAASNVAGLLIARGAHRTSETAVRMVLGASRVRIVRLLVSESLLLATAGGAIGLLVAFWLLRVFHRYTPGTWVVDTPFDGRVLAVTAAMCAGAGLVSGVTPALRAVRITLPGVLPGTVLTPSKRTRGRLRHLVLIPQVALSVSLMVIAGFHVRALLRTELVDPGYDTADRVVLNVGTRPQRGDGSYREMREINARRSRDFYRQLISRLPDVPGVIATAVAADLPLTSRMPPDPPIAIAEERAAEGASGGTPALGGLVSPGYFRTMGIRILSGRDFDDREVRLEGLNGSTIVPAPLRAIVSESVARALWQGRTPLGRRVAWVTAGPNQEIEWLEVIGVVEDVRPVMNTDAPTPRVYRPLGQQWSPFTTTVIAHVAGQPVRATNALAQAVAGAHSLAEIHRARTMDQAVAELLFGTRLIAAILSGAGLTGLLLASVGLYGVISYSVTRRIRELGVRCALGATRADIVRHVMKEGAAVTAIGMAIGGWLTYAALKAGTNTPITTVVDRPTMVIVPLVLAAVILLASYIPARRAARVDPLESLRAL